MLSDLGFEARFRGEKLYNFHPKFLTTSNKCFIKYIDKLENKNEM